MLPKLFNSYFLIVGVATNSIRLMIYTVGVLVLSTKKREKLSPTHPNGNLEVRKVPLASQAFIGVFD